MFQHVDAYAGDPILSLMEEFGKDERTEKVNLSIGLYYNEDTIVPQLNAVKQALKNIEPLNDKVKLYLPMDGSKSYNTATQLLVRVKTLRRAKMAVRLLYRPWVAQAL